MTSKITTKNRIEDRFYEGERPLYALGETELDHVRFYPGESPLKHSHDIVIARVRLHGQISSLAQRTGVDRG